MTTTHPSHSYLSYEPKPSIKGHCPNHFFDKIGFKSADASAQMRIAFIADMTTHFKSRSHKNLTRTKDPKAFKIVVSEFLAEFGSSYWGDSERDHLQESDPLKAFLCPRDARRENSR